MLRYLGSPSLAGPERTSTGEQALKLLEADVGAPKDGPERAAVELAVIGYDDLVEWVKAAQDDVAAMLANEPKAAQWVSLK